MPLDRLQRTVESAARTALATALSPVPGPKAILIEDSLYDPRLSVSRPLDLFTDSAFLREHGIRHVVPLSSQPIHSSILSLPALVVLIRGVNAAAARYAVLALRTARQRAASQSRPNGDDDSKNNSDTPTIPDVGPNCLVLTTPRRSMIVEKVFRSAALSDIPIAPLPLGFLPFDADLVTLDWPEAYRQIVLDGDNSSILATASALSSLATSLNLSFGTIRSAGAAAAAVAEELLHTHGQKYPRPSSSISGSTSGSPASTVAHTPSSFSPNDAFVLPDSSAERNNDSADAEEPTLADVAVNGSRKRPVTLLIIDRGVDIVSPMLTQWTYEGLLDEAVGLHNNVMDLPVSSIVSEDAIGILSSSPDGSGSVRKRLRSDVDRIFSQLRDLNYWSAVRQIGSVATSVRDYYERRPTKDTSEIAQVKDYVKGLREVKTEHLSAAAHTAIAAEISARTFDSMDFKRRFELEREMIEGSSATERRTYVTDAIARGESIAHVMRVCCLWSVTSGGVDGEELDVVKREMLANYGLGVLRLLGNLERAGMVIRSNRQRESGSVQLGWIPLPRLGGASDSGSDSGKSEATSRSQRSMRELDGRGQRLRAADYSWQFARAALRLVTEFDPEKEVRAGTGAAVAAPYSGYTPLSVRLVETGLGKEGWSGLPAVVAHTPLLPPGHTTVEHRRREAGAGGEDDGMEAVVVFVGGVARAEASAVRLAAQAAGVKAVIATTAVMGPDEFVLSLSNSPVAGAATGAL